MASCLRRGAGRYYPDVSLSRRQPGTDLTLRVSGAVLAILTFAATVSAATARGVPSAAIAGMLIVSVDAGGGIEEISCAPGASAPAPVRTATCARARTESLAHTAPLDERLTDLPPPCAG